MLLLFELISSPKTYTSWNLKSIIIWKLIKIDETREMSLIIQISKVQTYVLENLSDNIYFDVKWNNINKTGKYRCLCNIRTKRKLYNK